MKEENNGTSNNKWSRIFRKKWFFPALYLVVAAVLLTVVIWYQNLDNQVPDATDDSEDPFSSHLQDEEAESVLEQQEIIKMPLADNDQAEIVTKFYDYNAEEEEQESGLVLYNNRYYQSKGIDIKVGEDEAFDVVASLSGEVTEVKEDPLLGNVVSITHDNDVMTYYASMGEISVKAGDEVEQGDTLGTAGKNLFGKDNGTHVHFQIRKDGVEVDPEAFFNQPVSKLDEIEVDEDVVDSMEENEEPTEEEQENADEAAEEDLDQDETDEDEASDEASEDDEQADDELEDKDQDEQEEE